MPRRRIGCGVECIYSTPFDTNGVLYHIATAGGTRPYANPHDSGEVIATVSSSPNLPRSPMFGKLSGFVQHTHPSSVIYFVSQGLNPWMAVDLGEGRSLRPTHYCLRSDQHAGHKLRSWRLEGSNGGEEWTPLRTHMNDTSLAQTAMSVAGWPIEGIEGAFRHFRIILAGVSSNGTEMLMCTGIELYGLLHPRAT